MQCQGVSASARKFQTTSGSLRIRVTECQGVSESACAKVSSMKDVRLSRAIAF